MTQLFPLIICRAGVIIAVDSQKAGDEGAAKKEKASAMRSEFLKDALTARNSGSIVMIHSIFGTLSQAPAVGRMRCREKMNM